MEKVNEISNILDKCIADMYIKEDLISEISSVKLTEDIEQINEISGSIKMSDDLFIRLNYSYHSSNGKFELFSLGGNDNIIIRKWSYHNLGKLFYKYYVPKFFNYVTREGNVLWDRT